MSRYSVEGILVAEHATPHKLLYLGLQKLPVGATTFLISPFHCSPCSLDSSGGDWDRVKIILILTPEKIGNLKI